MNRLHPQDLRALVAATMWGGEMTMQGCFKMADALLAELERTSKPESRAPLPGEVDREMLVNHVEALTARAEKAEAGWEAASKTLLGMEKRNGELWSANVDLSQKVRALEERIETAKCLLDLEELLEPKP